MARAVFEWGGSLGWMLAWGAVAVCLWRAALCPTVLRGTGIARVGFWIAAAFGALFCTAAIAGLIVPLLGGQPHRGPDRLLGQTGIPTSYVMSGLGWWVLVVAIGAGCRAVVARLGGDPKDGRAEPR